MHGLVLILLIINIVFRIAQVLIFAYVIVSWAPKWRYSTAGRWLERYVGTALRPLRQLVPPHTFGGIDISPIIALILLQILQQIIFRILLS